MPELFNPIGATVEKVAPTAVSNGANDVARDEDERVVEEVESLCMNCEENVGFWRYPRSENDLLTQDRLGHNATPPYQDPLFPRDHHHVLLMRQVRLP
jgi:hypothetical protein